MSEGYPTPDWDQLEKYFENEVLRTIDRLNRLLSEKIVVLRTFEDVRKLMNSFFRLCEVVDENERVAIAKQILDLHKSKEQEALRTPLKAWDEQTREWTIAVSVIESAVKYGDEWMAESQDIKNLLKWLRGSIFDDPSMATPQQLQSSYKRRIYEIVEAVRRTSTQNKTVILQSLNQLLSMLYPEGIRRSETLGALEKAYQDGSQRSKPPSE